MKQQPGRVTLKQISQEAGVSIATVSLVLRGKDRAHLETRRRVQEAAARLRYRPNLLVHSVQQGRSRTIGVVVPLVGFFGQLVHGLYLEIVAEGYLPVLHYQTDLAGRGALRRELDIIHRLLDQRVDGIVLLPGDESVADLYFQEVWERGIPLVAVDRLLGMKHADFVGTDDFCGGSLAARHLLELGHSDLAHLAGRSGVATFAARREGFAAQLEAAGARLRIVESESEDDYSMPARRLLRLRPRPSGVFLARDDAAPAVYAAAEAAGLRIPEDLSVVGFADLDWAGYLRPPLTTLHQDAVALGRRAGRLLLDRIEGRETSTEPQRVQLRPELVVRASTAAWRG